jgi:aspartyl protease family protein
LTAEGSTVPSDSGSRTGRRLAWLAAIGAIIGLTAFYQALSPGAGGLEQSVSGPAGGRVVLKRDRSGHFMASGAINGQAVNFLVDTGATDVAVSESAARALGLEFGPRTAVMTAAGPAPAWMTRLDRVSIGSISLNDVSATITPGLGSQALLGMSFLKHFEMHADGDRLEIAARSHGRQGAPEG